eukprot:TRINITY_DN4281_c0_g1_i1.p1 TRINITY_DN4281_c0_g1~~TRINITY_DN4281_c0_g1_i1.p1  ORF type:complete len:126 (+),score=63.87 TRINITY_DN4281_c0_g1_i1:74-451(+)
MAEEQDDSSYVEDIVRKQLHAFIERDLDAANEVAHPKYKRKEGEFDKMFQEQYAMFGKDADVEYVNNTYVESAPGPPHFMAKFCLVQVKQKGGIGMVDYVKCQMDKASGDKWMVAEWQQDPPEDE